MMPLRAKKNAVAPSVLCLMFQCGVKFIVSLRAKKKEKIVSAIATKKSLDINAVVSKTVNIAILRIFEFPPNR
jgi:hypothetical protein